MTESIIVIIVICLAFKFSNALTACSGETVGADVSSSTATDTSGTGYLIEDETYMVKCCGYVSSWKFSTSSTGSVTLQIWRKTASNSYTLIGRNQYSVTSTGTTSRTVSAADRIPVRLGDIIGWYSSPNIIIRSNNVDSGYPVLNWYTSVSTDITVGNTFDWSLTNTVSQHKFAIEATVEASTVPSFLSASSVTINDTTAADENILTLSVNDDGGDTHVFLTKANDSPYFYVDTANGYIRTRQTNIPEGTYSITPMVTDNCYNTGSVTITITVQNVPISVDGFSEVSATISENSYVEQKLTKVLVTEPNDNYYCYFTSSSNFPFIVRQETSMMPDYAIYLQDWPRLDYDTYPSYTLVVECKEAISAAPASASGTFTVYITENTAPTMAISTDSVNVTATTEWIGELVYTVQVTDPENDTLTMTLLTDPVDGPFTITDDGRIFLTENVLRHTRRTYTLTATATDTYANTVNMTINVAINNINFDPLINNLPTTLLVSENEVLGKSIFQVDVTDADSDVIEFYAQFNPAFGAKLFTVDSSSGVVYTSSTKNIDYDTISDRSLEIYVTASDGKYFVTKTLTINITNVNEPPVISQEYFRIERNEGVSGDTFPAIHYDVDDPDITSVSDVITYSKDCGANDYRVSMTTSNGIFSFSVDYDLDIATNPTDFTCTVTVTDIEGLNDTCVVDVHVNYVNEFAPNFTKSFYSIEVLYTELVGVIVMTANAIDEDLGNDGNFYYEISNTENLFGIFQNGSVFLMADLQRYYPNGYSLVMSLTAVDTGGFNSSVNINVTIPSAVATTEQPHTLFSYPMNMATFEIAAIFAVACLGLAIVLIVKYINPSTSAARSINVKPYEVDTEEKSRFIKDETKNDPKFHVKRIFKPQKIHSPPTSDL